MGRAFMSYLRVHLCCRGKFGEVKRCRELATGREFAAKFIATPRPQDKTDVECEISTMRRLHHRRIVQLYEAFETKKEMCLILEMCGFHWFNVLVNYVSSKIDLSLVSLLITHASRGSPTIGGTVTHASRPIHWFWIQGDEYQKNNFVTPKLMSLTVCKFANWHRDRNRNPLLISLVSMTHHFCCKLLLTVKTTVDHFQC